MIAYHATSHAAAERILDNGLRVGQPNNLTMGGVWADEIYGIRPIYLSMQPGYYSGDIILEIDLSRIDYVADLPSLVDAGAIVAESGIYWEDHTPRPFIGLSDNGEFYLDDLLDPGNVMVDTAILVTDTLAVLEDIPPNRITIYEP